MISLSECSRQAEEVAWASGPALAAASVDASAEREARAFAAPIKAVDVAVDIAVQAGGHPSSNVPINAIDGQLAGVCAAVQQHVLPELNFDASVEPLTNDPGAKSFGLGSGQDEQLGASCEPESAHLAMMYDAATSRVRCAPGTACTGPDHHPCASMAHQGVASNQEPTPPGSMSVTHADANITDGPLGCHKLDPSPVHEGTCHDQDLLRHRQHLGPLGVHDDTDTDPHMIRPLNPPKGGKGMMLDAVTTVDPVAVAAQGFGPAGLMGLEESVPMALAGTGHVGPPAPTASPPAQGSDGSGSGSGQTMIGMAMGFPVVDVVSHPLFGVVPQVLCGADVAALTAQAQAHLTRASQMAMSRPLEAHGSLTAAAAAAAIAATAAAAAAAATRRQSNGCPAPDGAAGDTGEAGQAAAAGAGASAEGTAATAAVQGVPADPEGTKPPGGSAAEAPMDNGYPSAAAAAALAGIQPPIQALDSMQQLQVYQAQQLQYMYSMQQWYQMQHWYQMQAHWMGARPVQPHPGQPPPMIPQPQQPQQPRPLIPVAAIEPPPRGRGMGGAGSSPESSLSAHHAAAAMHPPVMPLAPATRRRSLGTGPQPGGRAVMQPETAAVAAAEHSMLVDDLAVEGGAHESSGTTLPHHRHGSEGGRSGRGGAAHGRGGHAHAQQHVASESRRSSREPHTAAGGPDAQAHTFKYIVQVASGAWRAQVGHNEAGLQRKFYGCYRRTAHAAALDADKLLYKLRGGSAPLNLGLDADQRSRLDSMTLMELLAELQDKGPAGPTVPVQAPVLSPPSPTSPTSAYAAASALMAMSAAMAAAGGLGAGAVAAGVNPAVVAQAHAHAQLAGGASGATAQDGGPVVVLPPAEHPESSNGTAGGVAAGTAAVDDGEVQARGMAMPAPTRLGGHHAILQAQEQEPLSLSAPARNTMQSAAHAHHPGGAQDQDMAQGHGVQGDANGLATRQLRRKRCSSTNGDLADAEMQQGSGAADMQGRPLQHGAGASAGGMQSREHGSQRNSSEQPTGQTSGTGVTPMEQSDDEKDQAEKPQGTSDLPSSVTLLRVDPASIKGEQEGSRASDAKRHRPSLSIEPLDITGALHSTEAQLGATVAAAASALGLPPTDLLQPSGAMDAAAAGAELYPAAVEKVITPGKQQFRYIVKIGNRWRAQVGHMEAGVQRKFYGCYVSDPEVAAHDADMILYKLRGPGAATNFTMAPHERAYVDANSLNDLIYVLKSGGGALSAAAAAASGASAGVPGATTATGTSSSPTNTHANPGADALVAAGGAGDHEGGSARAGAGAGGVAAMTGGSATGCSSGTSESSGAAGAAAGMPSPNGVQAMSAAGAPSKPANAVPATAGSSPTGPNAAAAAAAATHLASIGPSMASLTAGLAAWSNAMYAAAAGRPPLAPSSGAARPTAPPAAAGTHGSLPGPSAGVAGTQRRMSNGAPSALPQAPPAVAAPPMPPPLQSAQLTGLPGMQGLQLASALARAMAAAASTGAAGASGVKPQ